MSPAPKLLSSLAAELGRTVEGGGGLEIGGVASLADAGPSDLGYVRSERFAPELAASKVGAVIAPPGLDTGGRPTIRSPDPGLDFARAVRWLRPRPAPLAGVASGAQLAPGARVDPTAHVAAGCVVGPGAVIGPRTVLHSNVSVYAGVNIGADCIIHSGCVLREETEIGDRVVLQPGVVIGADGFGYAVNEQGAFEPVPQVGRVVLEDDVEIGANATVDRATLGETRIARGSKLDNLVMVGHNSRIGEDVLVVAQAGLAGSVTLERGALVLAQAGLADHVRVGERAYIGPQTGVTADVEAGARVLGTPHNDLALTRRIWVSLRRLPDVLRRLRAIERRLGIGGAGRDGG